MNQAKLKGSTHLRLSALWSPQTKLPKPDRLGLKSGQQRVPLRARVLLPVLLTALLVSLGVASLRIDLLRVRYALAAATLEEQRLLDESRALTAQMRRLRDPYHLALQARELGFVRPARLIDLRDAERNRPPAPERVAAHRPRAVSSLP